MKKRRAVAAPTGRGVTTPMVAIGTCHRVSCIGSRRTWHPSRSGPLRSGHSRTGRDHMLAVVGGAVAFVLVAGWALLRWQMRGRDPSYLDDASILLPAPPEGMTAATATVIDGGPSGQAFMAGLLDLASRDEIRFRARRARRPGAGSGSRSTARRPTTPGSGSTDGARSARAKRGCSRCSRAYAIEGQTGLSDMERGLAAMQSMGGLAGFAALSLAAGAPDGHRPDGRRDERSRRPIPRPRSSPRSSVPADPCPSTSARAWPSSAR